LFAKNRFKHTLFSRNTFYLPSRHRGNERQISLAIFRNNPCEFTQKYKSQATSLHRLQWYLVVGFSNETYSLVTVSSCSYREVFSQAVFKCIYTVWWICKTAFNTGLILCRWEQRKMNTSRLSLMVWRKWSTMV